MSIFNITYPQTKLLAEGVFSPDRRKYFIWFCAFWMFIAFLEFGQDYISSVLNDNAFILADSLSYKLFWLLFIPFSIVLVFGAEQTEKFLSGMHLSYFAVMSIIIIGITAIHLFLFSVILYGFSLLLHNDPVRFLLIIYEKLSTRLYLSLSIYVALSGLYLYVKRSGIRQHSNQQSAPSKITVKNGKSSVIVDISDIIWIGSDGAYLDIHTSKQKHVVLDSLKNIIKTLPDNFKRIHKSTIVNIDWVRELKSRGNGDYDVIMDDDRVLRLSRNYAKNIKGLLL